MEQLPASKYRKPSAVISGIDKSSNGGPLTRPGTTSHDHERATVSVRGTVKRFDRFQGVDDPSWPDRLPHMVMVNDSVDVIDQRTPSEAALASLRLTKGN
jgi:hypothetical protein